MFKEMILVGRVTRRGSRVFKNEEVEGLYLREDALFFEIKNRIYLKICKETENIVLSVLKRNVELVSVGEDEDMQKLAREREAIFSYLKQRAKYVGELREGRVIWIEDTWSIGIKQKTLRELWVREINLFELIGNKIYYLKPNKNIVEALYFKCVEIAGSELGLAKSLVRDIEDDKTRRRKVIVKNIAAFRRFNFGQRDTFVRYANLFVQYLRDHDMPENDLFACFKESK